MRGEPEAAQGFRVPVPEPIRGVGSVLSGLDRVETEFPFRLDRESHHLFAHLLAALQPLPPRDPRDPNTAGRLRLMSKPSRSTPVIRAWVASPT